MTVLEDPRRLGLLWAFASAVAAALFAVPWKLANAAGYASHSVLVLLCVAALANSALVVGQRGTFRISRLDVGVAALLAGFTLFGNLASALAIQQISPALLNVLLRAEVILVAVFAWMLLGERVERRFWVGVGLAAVGLMVLQAPRHGAGVSGFLASGTGLALVAAACFSSLTIAVRHFVRRIDLVSVNALRLWFAVALWFPFHPLPRLAEIPGEQLVYAGLAAIAGPLVGRLCLMISARYIEARLSALANLATPVMTLFFAFALLSDWPQRHELLGGAIMVAGIAVPLLRRAGRHGRSSLW